MLAHVPAGPLPLSPRCSPLLANAEKKRARQLVNVAVHDAEVHVLAASSSQQRLAIRRMAEDDALAGFGNPAAASEARPKHHTRYVQNYRQPEPFGGTALYQPGS